MAKQGLLAAYKSKCTCCLFNAVLVCWNLYSLQFHTANEIYVYQPNNILLDDPVENGFIKPIKNDIAIIYVEKAIEFNEGVKPACMPKNEIAFGSTCYASGWGITNDFDIKSSEDLMTTPLNIFNKSECYKKILKHNKKKMTYEKFESFYNELFPEGICTSNQYKSACSGDSGGPFICEEHGKAVIHGIASGLLQFDLLDIDYGLYPEFSICMLMTW